MTRMNRSILVCCAVVFAGAAFADDAALKPSPTATPVAISPELRKKARIQGMHIEQSTRGILFCWEDASLGTRLKTKKCVDQDTFELLVQQRGIMRDGLQQGSGSCNGGPCGQIR
jgi:hypothetical protein